jgi:hypothetical protein
MKTLLTALSLGLALAASIYLLVWPVYSGVHRHQTANMTLVAINGPSLSIPVMFPGFVAVSPLPVSQAGGSSCRSDLDRRVLTCRDGHLPSLSTCSHRNDVAACVADSATMRDAAP